MRHIALLTGLLVLCAGASAQQVYRWVDDDGVVHYSDQPPPDESKQAEVVDVRARASNSRTSSLAIPAPIRAPSRSANTEPDGPQPSMQGEDQIYTQVIIDNPESQQVLWNIATRLRVTVTVEPALATSDRIQFVLDGQPMGEPQKSTSAVLSPVYRGEHKLEAEVINSDGKVLFRSPATTFYVQQASIN